MYGDPQFCILRPLEFYLFPFFYFFFSLRDSTWRVRASFSGTHGRFIFDHDTFKYLRPRAFSSTKSLSWSSDVSRPFGVMSNIPGTLIGHTSPGALEEEGVTIRELACP